MQSQADLIKGLTDAAIRLKRLRDEQAKLRAARSQPEAEPGARTITTSQPTPSPIRQR